MRFYVYILEREDGTPFYVGKGTGDRSEHHVREARRYAGINPHKERIIRKMLETGRRPVCRIDSRHEHEADALAREIALIAQIGRHNLGTGPLTNLTSGGDGIVGNVVSEAQKAAASAFHKARFQEPDAIAWARDNMARQRMAGLMGDGRRRLRQPEIRERRATAHAAKMSDPTYLAQAAEATRDQWRDPDFRTRHTERNRAQGRDPANLAVNSAATRERWAAGVYDKLAKGVMVGGRPYRTMSEAAAAVGTSINTLSARFRRWAKKGVFPEGHSYLPEDFPWHIFDQDRAAA